MKLHQTNESLQEISDTAFFFPSGQVGGSHYSHTGSGANYVCLPPNPDFQDRSTPSGYGYMYGAEYQNLGKSLKYYIRVATVMEKSHGKNIFSRSWKSQGILSTVGENEQF